MVRNQPTITVKLWQVDAFTTELFAGNPAAVVLLPYWLTDDVLLSIAAENNLAETAFLVAPPQAAAGGSTELRYHLRWFTPAIEVDLCGHATLASAWVLFQHAHRQAKSITFDTDVSGVLTVGRAKLSLALR